MFVEQFYKIDKNNEIRLVPKFTDCHVTPNNFKKMKVRYATQVLNATVVASLKKLILSCFISEYSCYSRLYSKNE